MPVCLDCDAGLYELKSINNTMKFDIFRRKKFKCTMCNEKFKTTKVVENAHRYLQIALAEELYLYCHTNNINFSDLRDALNTK